MLRCRQFLTIFFCLYILTSVTCSYAEEEIEDLIDIFESDSKIIAIVEGKKKIAFDLRQKEKVLWSDSNGYLGAFLTNDRFFVISTSSGSWRAFPLSLDESEKETAILSPYIALLVTGDRAIGFDAESNRFIETRLPIRDELLTAKVEKHVALVITSSRAFGLAAKSSSFIAIHLGARETIKETKITSSKATIHTSRRLLTFEASGAAWSEHRLN